MISDTLLKNLEEIVDSVLLENPLPYKKGNSVRIKNVVIRKNTHGFLIYDTVTNKQIAKTFFKSSALAIAKNLVEGNDVCREVIDLDKDLLKHYNDSVFYIRTIKSSKEFMVQEIRRARLDVSLDKTKHIRQQIDDFIF
jgi:hypothetical protein